MGNNQNLDVVLKMAEAQQDREMNSKISARMKSSLAELGARDGSRSQILSLVASENYQKALDELETYANSHAEYPQFKQRADRYLSYAGDLINAIRAKRSFPGMQHLSMSKQQELYDRAMTHFDDLKATLKKVEKIQAEVHLDDVRSTVWVIKAGVYCLFALLVLGFLLEVSRGVLPAANVVVDDAFGSATNAIFDKLGL
jgi:hypothetical protein